jgi:hypothetical protein
MLSTQAQSAVRALQARALATADSYQLDVTDRALDELIRNPGSQRPAAFQVRSARANASKVVRARRQVFDQEVLRNRNLRPGVHRQERLVQSPDEAPGDALDWLTQSPSLTNGQRRILLDLADGHDAQTLSTRDQVPLARIQERISRARRIGWEAYQHEMVAS